MGFVKTLIGVGEGMWGMVGGVEGREGNGCGGGYWSFLFLFLVTWVLGRG